MPLRRATPREIREIKRAYVTPMHFKRITAYSRDAKVAISFREAGKHTIQRIKEGSGCKPHSILEKSIKESTVLGLYPELGDRHKAAEGKAKAQKRIIDEAIGRFNQDYSPPGTDFDTFAHLRGYVGAWEGGKLVGVYITEEKLKEIREKADHERSAIDAAVLETAEVRGAEREHHILRLDFKGETEKDSEDEKEGEERSRGFPVEYVPHCSADLFFTGDYDLHEMAAFSGTGVGEASGGRARHILADSPEEKAHLGILDRYIAVGRVPKSAAAADRRHSEYSTIQHGPQESFIAHMLREERYKDIPESTARMGTGVAMCDRGQWYLFKTPEQNREWYESVGLTIKETWAEAKAPLPEPAKKKPDIISFRGLSKREKQAVREMKMTDAPPKQRTSEFNRLRRLEHSKVQRSIKMSRDRAECEQPKKAGPSAMK